MLKTKFSEFRSKAKHYFDLVENGEVVRILRNGKPIADITPIKTIKTRPSWKSPGVKIKLDNISLSEEIIRDRKNSR